MKHQQATRLMQTAGQLFIAGKYKEALRASAEALELYRELQDAQGIGTAAENMAGFNYHLGDYQQAALYARYSLLVCRRIGDKDGMSRAATLLGGSYLFQGKHEAALRWQEQSLKLAQEIGDEHGQLRALGNMAQALAALGKYVEAVERGQEALARLRADASVPGNIFYVRLQNMIGSVYRNVGEHEEANESFSKGLRKAEEIGDQLGESQSLINLGLGLIIQKKYEAAIEYLERSLKIKELVGDVRGQGVALNNLAQCHERLGRNDAALAGFHRTLEIARSIGHKQGEWQALGSIGLLQLKLQQYEEAAQYLNEARRVASEVADSTELDKIYRDLAHLAIATGHYEDAADMLRQSVTYAEAIRANLGTADDFKISIFEQHVVAYRELQWVLVEQGRAGAALEMAERGRARALSASLLRRMRQRDSADINQTPPTLTEIRELAAAEQTTFFVYSLITDPRRSLLTENDEIEIFIWVVPPRADAELAFHRTGPLPLVALTEKSGVVAVAMEEEPRREAHFLGQPRPAWADEQELKFLHQLLIEPVARLLPADDEALVTFVPDASLFLVPFAALQDRTGKHLIDTHTLSVIPSMHTLRLTRRERERLGRDGAGEALVVGNPEMPTVTVRLGQPPVKLSPLHYAEQEALAVAAQFKTHALRGRAATKAAILNQLARHRFVHLATHGIFDDLSNSKSPGAIALAPAADDNGLLTAEEIARLELNAELVVLSACHTGQGRVAAEGVIGLSRAFIAAGTPSVIVSLWAIPDAPTAYLMTCFYEALRHPDHPLDKAHALRQAMRLTKAAHPRPEDWAAFVLLGEPR